MQKNGLKVGIVGGGFAGVATAANLIIHGVPPLSIYLIEKTSRLAKGVAYSTNNPFHFLNVRTCHMGVFPGEPDGFVDWLAENQSKWRSLHPFYAELPIDKHSYVSRHLFGLYLSDILSDLIGIAKNKGIDFHIIHAEAIEAHLDSDSRFKLILNDASHLSLDHLVLATGVAPIKSLPFETPAHLSDPRYNANMWELRPESILRKENSQESVLIIGTGLTMVDAVASLCANGFKGNIIALSWTGLLPEFHLELPGPPVDFGMIPYPLTARQLVAQFRSLISKDPSKWREVIDAVRPHIPGLWRNLPLVEKRRFLRDVFSIWNKYRHRMSPASALMLQKLIQEGRLQFIAGNIENIDISQPKQMQISYIPKGGNESLKIIVDNVVKCTGPDYSILRQKNRLIEDLLQKKLVVPDPLNMGLAITPEGLLQGKARGRIHALGILLFGEYFETMAVPEIRQQAHNTALFILRET